MTKRAAFDAEEWATVVDGPIYAALRVIAASHGGRLREGLALARAYQDARVHRGDSELLDELVKSPPAIDVDELRHAQSNIVEVAEQQLRDAVGTVGAKATPVETDSYKKFVMTVAEAVASAHKEGGFLGVGGKQVTDAENQALDEISSALGSPPAT
jgi:predicted urease superfamily metal-dependent hydrolase